MTNVQAEPGWANLSQIDRLVHEPARLAIMAVLYVVAGADFLYLERETGLTKGNLSSHLTRLEEAGYIEIEKTFTGRIPRTVCRLSAMGRDSFRAYLARMKGILALLPD